MKIGLHSLGIGNGARRAVIDAVAVAAQALEQDRAAGGRDRRVIKEGGALGRVVLRRWHRRSYAELRWQTNNKECSKYLREVSADDRAANLAAAWQRARDLGLISPSISAPS